MTSPSPRLTTLCRIAVFGGIWLAGGSFVFAAAVDFNRDIQPILSENCYHCHGPDGAARKAKLRLDQKEGALGKNEDGRAIVAPGKPEDSELITRIQSADSDEMMPPQKSHRTLTTAQKQLLTQWVEQGAPWAKHWAFVAPERPATPGIADCGLRIADLRNSDAVRADELHALAPTWSRWPRNPIDNFVLASLLREGLMPSPESAPEKLCRRLYLDLTGLPPAPTEVDAFRQSAIRDPQSAIPLLVDRLMASPRYGERMVWEWLDAARYADTNGYQGDPTRAMWYWRDWAVKALNDNMPFDQFTIEQIAGDLLPERDASKSPNADSAATLPASWIRDSRHDQLIATGFHRNHMINGEGGRIAEESRVDYVQDRVETTGAVWLGLTLTCCRCHDHKFDPILQREYYQFSAYFNSIDETGANDSGGLANPVLSFPSPEEQKKIDALKARESEAAKTFAKIEKKLRAEQSKWERMLAGGGEEIYGATDSPALFSSPPDRIRQLLSKADDRTQPEQAELTKYYLDSDSRFGAAQKQRDDAKKARESGERSAPRTMVMRDRPQPRETFILVKGAYDKYADKVECGTPASLPPLPPDAPKNRLAMARWLVSPENPLTARVIVNRYWQMFFGRGLVKTAEDFGVQGDKPTHPELLDWLAREFIESGWDVKHLVRLIVTSATYRQQSNFPPGMEDRDPENKLLARGPRFRLPSWMLRDQALAVSGLLTEKVGGPPVKVYQPANVWEDATFGQIKFSQDHGEALYRRSLYVFWRRIVGPTLFFDVATRQQCAVKVGRTNTPLHALITLNDTTYVEAARALAERILREGGATDSERLAYGFRLCTARLPDEKEASLLAKSLAHFREQYFADEDAARKLIAIGESKAASNLAAPELAAHTGVALLLLNLDETLSKE